MKREKVFISLMIIALQFFISCTKESQNKCEDVSLSLNITPSHPCTGTGSVFVNIGGNDVFKFGLNNLPAQESNQFTSLKTGNYTLRINTLTNCDQDTIFTVPVIPSGPQFSEVKNLLNQNCSRCHSGNNPQAGIDLTNDCVIISSWQRIKQRAIYGDPSPMPTNGLIPLTEREKILRWINSGHRFED